MIATAVVAGFGFLFWLLSARLFSTEEVGLAGTLISVMNTIALFSLFGFDSSAIRYLSRSKSKDSDITTGFVVITLISLILTGIFLLLIPHISPALRFITENTHTAVAFLFFTTATALNIYTDALFLAYRKTKYTLYVNTIFSFVKIFLPFAFIGFGAFGILAAAASAQTIGFILSLFILMHTFAYKPSHTCNTEFIRRVWKFSLSNYVADACMFLPIAILPILVTNKLGAEEAAHYYIVTMLTGFLYVIPASTMRSLFAEGSHNENTILKNITRSIKTTALFLVPLVVLFLLFGKMILELFGTTYSSAITFLYVTVLTSFVVSIFTLYGSVFKLTQSIMPLLARNGTYTFGTILLSYMLIPYGLTGIGIAFLGGYLLAVCISFILFPKDTMISKHPFSFTALQNMNLLPRIQARLNEYFFWPLKTIYTAKCDYWHAMHREDYVHKTILFYPEAPKTYHTLYKICNYLGWDITTNPKKHADIRIFFEDTTFRKANATLRELHKKYPVLNIDCEDISKKHVEEIFSEVFKYQMSVDPRTHQGTCVRKSNINAVHDGTVRTCPCEPEEGYIYQKLIPTHDQKGRATDLRLNVFKDSIPVALKRYKNANDIFNITVDAEFCSVDEILSKDEQEKILLLCQKMGLDYGEIDALRSNDDGKLYVVDVNNTPAGPIGPIYNNNTDLHRWFKEIARYTKETFSN
jgi:O-antigen/teichoic acid export membrane protein